MRLTVYLAGEIHSDWRATLRTAAAHLPIDFVAPMENHDQSDAIGEDILGTQATAALKDDTASQFNNLRSRVLMTRSDLVIAYFGEKFKQWNTAMDAGQALATGKPLILINDGASSHALKELSNRAQATVYTIEQAVQALGYIVKQ